MKRFYALFMVLFASLPVFAGPIPMHSLFIGANCCSIMTAPSFLNHYSAKLGDDPSVQDLLDNSEISFGGFFFFLQYTGIPHISGSFEVSMPFTNEGYMTFGGALYGYLSADNVGPYLGIKAVRLVYSDDKEIGNDSYELRYTVSGPLIVLGFTVPMFSNLIEIDLDASFSPMSLFSDGTNIIGASLALKVGL